MFVRSLLPLRDRCRERVFRSFFEARDPDRDGGSFTSSAVSLGSAGDGVAGTGVTTSVLLH